MGLLAEWRRRLDYWRNQDRYERELDEEMRFHLESAGSGAKSFGNVTLLRERSRDVWGWPLVESIAVDVRYTLRGFRKSPLFAAIAIGTLAVAIGGGTAIVSLAEAILFRPLPYRNADELTLIFEGTLSRDRVRGDTSPATYRALRNEMKSLRGLAVYQPNEMNLSGDGEPERLDAVLASANFFDTVGVQPFLGRFFREGEDEPGKDGVVILSYELWQRRFGGDTRILNQTIHLSEALYTVIGVLPPNFRYHLDRGELWTPFALSPERWASRGSRYVYVTGRRAPAVSVEAVQAELDALAARYRKDYPRECSVMKLQAVDLHDRLTEESSTSLYFLLAAVFGLLLIACSNVASLLLTRAVARGAELSVRTALGASSGRLVRQLLTESLVLALTAGVASLAVAAAVFRILQPLVPPGMLAFTRLQLDWSVVAIQFALALFCTLASGMMPSFRAAGSLTTRAIGGRHHETMRSGLIAGEIALAILLLTGAALLFRTFQNLNGVNPGFQPEHLISAQTVLPREFYRDPAKRTLFYTEVTERLAALPGITGAAFTSAVPTIWKGGFSAYTAADKPFQPGISSAMMRQVTPEYFRTMKIPLLEGRLLTADDNARSEMVTVVNQSFARQVWPGESPLGKRIHRGDPQSGNPWITVVGVVGDVYELGLASKPPVITYLPESQHPAATFSSPNYLVARTSGDPAAMAAAVRRIIHEVNPNQSVAKLKPVNEVLASESAQQRIQATITVAFALTALFLACLGIYGVLSYAVAQRRQEFGVRLALGATPRQLVSLVMNSGVRLTLIGAVIGLTAAAGLTRFMETLLFQVRPLEPAVFAGVTVILALTAMFACWLPARRARKVEPAHALRYD
ncbi:MAG: ABC transporter permease [Acidobacteria bacterium]|nr:ABC transporter permease [Acidobacteriota bacterium]